MRNWCSSKSHPTEIPRISANRSPASELRALSYRRRFATTSACATPFRPRGIRVVAIGADSRDQPHSTVGIDDIRAAFQLTQHLLALGHRRIGFIGGPPRHNSSARRWAGYHAALLDFGLAPDPSLQWQGENTYASALALAEQALSSERPPTAIFAANDDMAAAVLTVAERRGFAVPDALTVCGFDDSEIAQIVSPQLTMVSQPVGAMAEWAVRQLVRELSAMDRGEEPEVRKAVLHHVIVRRASDAAAYTRTLVGGGRGNIAGFRKIAAVGRAEI